MNLEQKDHFHRISALTKQLDTAKNTVTSMETINVSTNMGQEKDLYS